MEWASLDELLEGDHRARLVWEAVTRLKLDSWLREIKAVQGHVGRDATDPRQLVALWVYATLEGIGSAASWTVCASITWPASGCAAGSR